VSQHTVSSRPGLSRGLVSQFQRYDRAAAEESCVREARALRLLSVLTGVEQPVPTIARLRHEAAVAEARGFPPPQFYRTDHTARVKAWLAIVDAFGAGRSPRHRNYQPETRADRIRRHERRLARLCKALALQADRRRRPVDVTAASSLIGLAPRTIHRAIQERRLPAVPVGAAGPHVRHVIRIPDLAQYALARVSA
jgi:hypothetical protein